MNKKLLILLAASVTGAAIISANWQPVPFEERAIQLQLEHAPAPLAAALQNQPIAIQAAILDYQHDPVLLLKAQTALLKYPQYAREILPLYADKPEFQEILRTHGETILPPIHYFLTNDVATLRFAHAARQRLRAFRQQEPEPPLTPELRGWYAVQYIHAEAHDFLGQFRMTDEGEPKWIQSERVLEAASRFFTSGIRDLETKFQTDETPTAGDYGWAAVDALVVASAVQLLRLGRAASTSGQSIKAPTRTAALSLRTANNSRLGTQLARYGKWPALAAAAYIAIRHPNIISDALVDLAHQYGIPTGLALFLGWTLLLLPALYIATWLLRLLLSPALALLNAMQNLLAWLDTKGNPHAVIGKMLAPSRGWVRMMRGDDF